MKRKSKRRMSAEELAIRARKSTFYKRVSRSRAFADVLDGVVHPKLPYRGRGEFGQAEMKTPADRLYQQSRRHVEAALADFRGEEPKDSDERAERRAARKTQYYKTCIARFNRLADPYIEAEIMRRTRDIYSGLGMTVPTTATVATVESVAATSPKGEPKPSLQTKRPPTSLSATEPKSDSVVQVRGAAYCEVCEASYSGDACPTCEKQERRDAKRIAGVVKLLSYGSRHSWPSVIEAARGTGYPLDDDEQEWLRDTLDEDDRFECKNGMWSMKPTTKRKNESRRSA